MNKYEFGHICSVAGCSKMYFAKGYCKKHYNQLPEVRAKRNAYAREYRKRLISKQYYKEYNQRPEVKQRRKEYKKEEAKRKNDF